MTTDEHSCAVRVHSKTDAVDRDGIPAIQDLKSLPSPRQPRCGTVS